MLVQSVFDLAFLYQTVPRIGGIGTPSQANMILWYAADMETAYSSSQLITTLTDQSGNSNSASINVSSPNVKYTTNILNGKPVFYFTSSGGFFQIKDFGHVTSSLTQSAEYIVVLRSAADPLTQASSLGPVMLASASNQGTPALPYTDGKMYELFATTTGNRVGTKPTSASLSSSFRIFNVVSTTSSFEMLYDGKTIYFDSSSTPNTFGLSAPYLLGKVLNVNGNPWEGMIAEFMVHAPALADSQRSQTYAYLNGKYAMTAPYTTSVNITPASYSDNLVIWLTVDSLSALTTGSNIGVWSASYGTNHFSSSGTTAPIYKGNMLNGRAAVAFNTSTYFTASTRFTIPANTPFTVMSVVQAHADSVLVSHDGSSQNFQLRVRRANAAQNGLFCNAQNELLLGVSRNAGDFQTAVWKRGLSGSNVTALRSMPLNSAFSAPAVNQCLSSRIGGTDAHGLPLTGSICEFIAWNRAVEDWEIVDLWTHYIYPKYRL